MSKIITLTLFFISVLSYGQGNLGPDYEPFHIGGNRYVLPPIDMPLTPTEPGKPISPGTMKPSMDNPNKPTKGNLKWGDGSVYSGIIKGGKPDGFGTLRYSNGAVYEGDFVRGVREGNGKVGFPIEDGSIATYEGTWRDDFWNGEGVYSNNSFSISGNVFKNGRITGVDAKVQAKGEKSYYQGGIKNGKLHGIGKVYNSAGNLSGEYLYDNGDIVGIVLSKNSKETLDKIKNVAESTDLGKKILLAYTAFIGFDIIDDAPENISMETLRNKTIVTLFNANETIKGADKSEDFFTMIAKGVRDLEKIKTNQINKLVNEQLAKAKISNNRSEQLFWQQFKNRLRRKTTRRRGF